MQSGNVADGNGEDRISAPNQQLTLLKSMLELESLFDFSIYGLSPDGDQTALQPIRTFKSVLAAGSKYFRCMFTNNNFNDSQTSDHKSEIFSHECLKSLVEFLHKGDIRAENTRFAIDLLKAAQFYQVDDLVLGCEAYLERHLKVDNGIDVWKFACQHDCSPAFVAEIEKFIAKNLKLIVKERNFLALKPAEQAVKLAGRTHTTVRGRFMLSLAILSIAILSLYTTISGQLTLRPAAEICKLLSIKPVVTSVSADICLRAALAWLEHDPENRKVSSAAVLLNSSSLCPGILSRQRLIDACRSKAMSPFATQQLSDLFAYHLDLDYNNEFICVPDYVEPSLGPGVSPTSFSIEDLYFVGGEPEECRKQYLQYNVNRKEWIHLEPLPWGRVSGSAGVFDGNRLLVFGGEKDNVFTADVDEFSFSTSKWSKISALPIACEWSACANQQDAYLTNSNGNLITYSASTKAIVRKKDMPLKRRWHSTSFSANLNAVFVADGVSGKGADTKYYPRIDKYDIASDAWQSVGFAKIKCSVRASVLCGDELYLVGGCCRVDDGAIEKVEVCNVRTGKVWSTPDLPAARLGCQAALLYNNVVCVFGDGKGVAACDVREGRWTTGVVVPDMPAGSGYFGLAWK